MSVLTRICLCLMASVCVNNVLAAPVAEHDYIKINGFLTYTNLQVEENDSCGTTDNSPCVIEITKAPLHGTAIIASNGALQYHLADNLCSDSPFDDFLEYQLVDPTGQKSLVTRATLDYDCTDVRPILYDLESRVNEGSGASFNPLAYAIDPLGQGLVVHDFPQLPASFTLRIKEDQSIGMSLTNRDFCGQDSFTVRARDADGNISEPARVSVEFTCINDAPVAVKDSITISPYSRQTLDVVANDIDVDGDKLTAVVTRMPWQGSYRGVQEGGGIVYDPPYGSCGSDFLEYKAQDPDGLSSSVVRADINFDCTDKTPVAVDVSLTISEDYPRSLTPLKNDIDPLGGGLKIHDFVTMPAHGTLSIYNDIYAQYDPVDNYCGTDSFVYRAVDSNGVVTQPATATINIGCSNDNPVAKADSFTVSSYQRAYLTVLDNDFEADGEALTIEVLRMPWNGTYQGVNQQGVIWYLPNRGSCGSDYLEYRLKDSVGSYSAKVRVDINHNCSDKRPIIYNASYTPYEDKSAEFNVLATAVDPVGQGLSIHDFPQPPEHGALSIKSNQRLRWTQTNKDYCGTDVFSYRAIDGAGVISEPAVVSLTIQCVDDTPMTAPDSFEASSDARTVHLPIYANDYNPDNLQTTFFFVQPIQYGSYAGFTNDGQMAYQPAKGQCGSDSFSYYLRLPGNIVSNTSTVTIDLKCVNDAPLAMDDTVYGVNEDAATLLNILANDSDPDEAEEALFDKIVEAPQFGNLEFRTDSNKLLYTPNANVCGVSDSFSYQLRDAEGLVSNVATVNITQINCVEDYPQVVDDNGFVYAGSSVILSPLDNDSEGDGEPIFIKSAHSGIGQVDVVNGTPQTLRFTPNAGYCGTGEIIYRVVDPFLGVSGEAGILGKIIMKVSCGDPGATTNTPTISGFSYDNLVARVDWVAENNADNYRVQREYEPQQMFTSWTNELYVTHSMAAGEANRFRVAACNSSGCSDYTEWTDWLGEPPAVPAAPIASVTQEGQRIEWQPSDFAILYDIELSYGRTGEVVTVTTSNTIFVHNSSLSDIRSYRVRACNAVDCSAYSEPSNIIGGDAPIVPAAPVAKIENACLRVNWNLTPASSSYRLQSEVNGQPWTTIRTTDATNYEDCSTINGQYRFRVAACNDLGCSDNSPASTAVGGILPETPEGLNASIVDSCVNVGWSPVTEASSYPLQINLNENGWTEVTNSTSESYQDCSPVQGQFTYRVASCNEFGCSDFSAPTDLLTFGLDVYWTKSQISVAEPIVLAGVVPSAVICHAQQHPDISFVPPETIFYLPFESPISEWQCKNAAGEIVQTFTSSLNVVKLVAPKGLKYN